MPDIDLSKYYTSEEATAVLSKKNGRDVNPSYIRMLVKYGKVRQLKIKPRFSVYFREDVDSYTIDSPGVKSGLASRKRAGKNE